MAVTAWAQPLSIEQSVDILRQCSLFLFSQHEPDKICFYPTKIVLEGNSMIWRTAAGWFGGIQKLCTGAEADTSRDLQKLVVLITKVQTCLQFRNNVMTHYFTDGSGKTYVWIDLIKEAKDGLTHLRDHQYQGNDPKQSLVNDAIDTLTETEKFFNTDGFELEQVMSKLSQEDADTLRRVIQRKDERIRQLEIYRIEKPYLLELE